MHFFVRIQCDAHEAEIRSALDNQGKVLTDKHDKLQEKLNKFDDFCTSEIKILKEQKLGKDIINLKQLMKYILF